MISCVIITAPSVVACRTRVLFKSQPKSTGNSLEEAQNVDMHGDLRSETATHNNIGYEYKIS
jgi:hypothetical protein